MVFQTQFSFSLSMVDCNKSGLFDLFPVVLWMHVCECVRVVSVYAKARSGKMLGESGFQHASEDLLNYLSESYIEILDAVFSICICL